MTNYPKNLEEALEMFDELYRKPRDIIHDKDGFVDFITTIWHAGRESVVKEGVAIAEEMRRKDVKSVVEIDTHNQKTVADIYNSALTDVITKLSELKEKK